MGLTSRIPGLRKIPIATLLAVAEIVLLAREHLMRLEPEERRRILELLRIGRGRPRNLNLRQQAELRMLIAKVDPRLFAGLVADKLSPVKLPKRVVHGKRNG